MATKVLRTIKPYKLPSRKSGLVWNRSPGEEASQTYKKGAPLVVDATSKELEMLTTGGASTDEITGIAAQDATGTTGAAVPYIEANDSNLFEASLINATTAVALDASHIKTKYGLIDDSTTGNWYVDVSNTTQTKVIVVEPIDAIGDYNARVVVRFLTNMQENVPSGA